MDYNQGQPFDSSQPRASYYGPYPYAYPHHYAAASSAPPYHNQPPPPGTERTAPSAVASSSSVAEASCYPADGMNPAAASAVAALTQLSDFAASMGASERAMVHQLCPPQYPQAQNPAVFGGSGTLMGGRRGGGLSRGGGRGRRSSMHYPPTQDIRVTSPRGRGRGRGRGRERGGRMSGRQVAIYAPAGSSAEETHPGAAPKPTQIQDVAHAHPGQVTTTNIAPGHVLPAAWCDICRVECNSMNILEQHKNGKRHKRTVQRMQEMAGLQGFTPAIHGTVTPASQVGGLPVASSELAEGRGPSTASHMVPTVGSSSHGGEDNKNLASENAMAAVTGVQGPEATIRNFTEENTVPATTAVGQSVEAQTEPHAAVEHSHQPETEMTEGGEAPLSNATGHYTPSSVQSAPVGAMFGSSSRNGPKRKTVRSDHGGKKPRTSEGLRRKPERVRERPIVCAICNVTCDTRAVFDIHLGGKKHMSRLKRSQGPDTVFGPLSVYIPPNQPGLHPVGAPEPVVYGLKSRDMVKQEAYLPGGMQYTFLPPAGAQLTSNVSCAVQPMAGVMDTTEKAGPLAEQVGNSGLVTAPWSTAAVEGGATEAPAPR